MMKARALLLGIAMAAALGAAANAADMPDNWRYAPPPPRYVEMASGWYLRGDIGYRLNHISSFEAPNAITSAKYGDSVGLSFGGGYKYQWFRADVTVDYGSQVKLNANSSLASVVQPQYSVKLETISALANAYIDLGSWWGFTPYIGGGAGVTYLRGSDYIDNSLPATSNNDSRTNFSWAAMAGVAYRFSARWTVDLGYRHLDMGSLPTTTGTNLSTDRTQWKGLSTDEVRIGFRYMFD